MDVLGRTHAQLDSLSCCATPKRDRRRVGINDHRHPLAGTDLSGLDAGGRITPALGTGTAFAMERPTNRSAQGGIPLDLFSSAPTEAPPFATGPRDSGVLVACLGGYDTY